MTVTFIVERKNLRAGRWVHTERAPLEAGAARLRIDSFALTSNNITYAAFGDTMNYWRFYPTGDASTGCIPVWGFGTVVESRCDGVATGDRHYGYFPIADEAVLLPGRIGPLFFAPAQISKRNADWGATVLGRRIAKTWDAFLRTVTDPAHPWLRVVHGSGEAAVAATYRALLDGKVPAQEGHVLTV